LHLRQHAHRYIYQHGRAERPEPHVRRPTAREQVPGAFILHALLHNADVTVNIMIRDVPEKVRDELAARAASQGRSMQEFLQLTLERLVARPTADAWLQQVRKRKRVSQKAVTPEQILKSRDADRR
jgi:antitoxin FitA